MPGGAPSADVARAAPRPIDVMAVRGNYTELNIPGLTQETHKALIEQYKKAAAEYKKLKEDGVDTLQIIQRARTRGGKLSGGDLDDLGKRFGLGQERDASGKKIAAGSPVKDQAQGLVDRSSHAIGQVREVWLYTEISRIAQEAGATDPVRLQEIVKSNSLLGANEAERMATWGTVRANALQTIADSQFIKDVMPDLQSLPPAARTEMLNAFLMNDPQLNAEIGERTSKVLEKAKALAPAGKNPEEALAEKQKTQVEGKQKKTMERLMQELDRKVTEADIKKFLDGRSADSVTIDVLYARLKAEGVKHPRELQKYIALDSDEQSLRIKSRILTTQLNRAAGNEETNLRNQLRDVEVQIEENRTIKHTLSSTLGSEAEIKSQMQKYNTILDDVYGRPDPTDPTGEKRVGGAKAYIDVLVKSQSELEAINQKLDQLAENRTNPLDQSADRLRQETDLINEIEGIVGESLRQVFLDRHEEVNSLNARRLQTQEEEARKKGENELADAIKQVNKSMQENWIKKKREVDKKGKSKTVIEGRNTAQIGTDMTFLAHYAEMGQRDEGIKRLLIRDLAKGSTAGFDGVNYETVDLDGLNDQQKSTLNQLFAQSGNSYVHRLFLDCFEARRTDLMVGKLGLEKGDLGFSKEQWLALEKGYGAEIEAQLKESKDAQELLKQLDKHGVKAEFKFKWLIWILMTLGLAGSGLGALGVLGGGGASAAVGSAAGLGVAAGSAAGLKMSS